MVKPLPCSLQPCAGSKDLQLQCLTPPRARPGHETTNGVFRPETVLALVRPDTWSSQGAGASPRLPNGCCREVNGPSLYKRLVCSGHRKPCGLIPSTLQGSQAMYSTKTCAKDAPPQKNRGTLKRHKAIRDWERCKRDHPWNVCFNSPEEPLSK